MRDLNFGLKHLVHEANEGSFGTRAARENILLQAATTLHDLGYRNLKPQGIKPKHVEALVMHWQGKELSAGTIKNRLSHVRWWADKVGKSGVVARNNDHYQVERRVYVTGVSKARELEEGKLDNVTDPYTKMSLRLQEAFGLRREEAIKFSPVYADKGDKISLKASWTKGGKARDIPIRNDEQRRLLEEARLFAGRGAMIPSNKNYIQQLKTYERNTAKAGLDKNHGLRHAYAQRRYEELTGWKSPADGGPARRSLDGDDRDKDNEVRLAISKELGHERISILGVYLG